MKQTPDTHTLRSSHMSRKSAILALAAAASLGAFALSSSSASALPGHLHVVGGPHPGPHFAIHPFPILYPPHHYWHWHWHPHYWTSPVVIGGGAAYASTPSYSSAPASERCTCLTKTYTQEGAVVFKDTCTNEMAMNPPANAQTTGEYSPPQQPQQQGYLQPQAR
jgi:hypothetical protein